MQKPICDMKFHSIKKKNYKIIFSLSIGLNVGDDNLLMSTSGFIGSIQIYVFFRSGVNGYWLVLYKAAYVCSVFYVLTLFVPLSPP